MSIDRKEAQVTTSVYICFLMEKRGDRMLFLRNRKSIACWISIVIMGAFLCVFVVEPHEVVAENDDIVVVCLGDSYSSGEGVDPYYGQFDGSGKERSFVDKLNNPDFVAHRSMYSWSSMLKPSKDCVLVKDSNYFFYAASGATTSNYRYEHKIDYDVDGLRTNADGKVVYSGKGNKCVYLPEQRKVFELLKQKGKKADYVVLTMGGNDLGFASIAKRVYWGFELFELWNLKTELDYARKYMEGSLKKDLKELYEAIHKDSEGATIIVAGYPELFSNSTRSVLVNLFEQALVNTAVHDFNQMIESVVEECRSKGIDIWFADVETAFKGRGAHSKNALINGLVLMPRAQDLDQNAIYSGMTLHPNPDGVKVYADCVQKVIDEKKKKASEQAEQLSESSSACVNYLLEIAKDCYTQGTPYWTFAPDYYEDAYYHRFAIGDFDGDGWQDLALQTDRYKGEFLKSDWTSSDLKIYKYSKKKKTMEEWKNYKLGNDREEPLFSNGDKPVFYSCTNDGIKQFCKDRNVSNPVIDDSKLPQMTYSFEDDRSLYREVLDDMYKAYKRNDSFADFPHYSEELFRKWNGGHYGRYYTFPDINMDGICELVVYETDSHEIASIYTLVNGKPVCLLDSVTKDNPGDLYTLFNTCISLEGIIFSDVFNPATGYGGLAMSELRDGRLVVKGYMGEPGEYYSITNNYEIDYSSPLSDEEVAKMIEDKKTQLGVCPFHYVYCDFNYYEN
ncbi:MAG: SGNH/GDSL hydrolase family protein [Eubacterium sp.]|nr:SGNH/GDSL hydrolase family protein [Eubacterium sp.]